MSALHEFSTTLTLCFTPEHLGQVPHYTSPPKNPQEFAEFTAWVVERYSSGAAAWANASENVREVMADNPSAAA
jgi:hypothetical protein